MKNQRTLIVCIALICVFFITACGSWDSDWESGPIFDYKLRGTWETHNSGSRYSGKLIIDYNQITVSGYSEIQTPENGDDSERPFRDIETKDIALSGYSEEGKIYIKHMGVWQAGIPYEYNEENYGQVKFLQFTFGNRKETLRLISN